MEKLSDHTAMILAGGKGLRLRSVVPDKPKVLAIVNERPFLSYILTELSQAGLRKVVLCTGYKGDQIYAEYGERYKKLSIAYSREIAPLGTGGALRLALPLVPTNTVLVLNGDSFCFGNILQFWSYHNRKKATASIMITRVADTHRYGRIQIGVDGKISRFDEKGSISRAGWINAGIYLLNTNIIKEISPTGEVSLERELIPNYVGRGLYGFKCQNTFIDIGTPASYERAKQLFNKRNNYL